MSGDNYLKGETGEMVSQSFRGIIAIDPGSAGGIAWNSPVTGMQAMGFPKGTKETIKTIRGIVLHLIAAGVKTESMICYMEKVTGFYPKKEGDDSFRLENQSHMMFTFGKNAGMVEGAMLALGVHVILVMPSIWQSKVMFWNSASGNTRQSKKAALKDKAQRMFPGIKVTLNTADALLIHQAGTLFEREGGYKPSTKLGKPHGGGKMTQSARFISKARVIDYRKPAPRDFMDQIKEDHMANRFEES